MFRYIVTYYLITMLTKLRYFQGYIKKISFTVVVERFEVLLSLNVIQYFSLYYVIFMSDALKYFIVLYVTIN